MSVDRCQSFQNSSLSSLPPAPVCHPSPSRPPARLLLQTQLRGHLDTLRKSHTGVSVSRDTCTLSSTHQPLASSSSLLPSLLQHHCSIPHHHSSSTHLQKLFFFYLCGTTFTLFPDVLLFLWFLQRETDLCSKDFRTGIYNTLMFMGLKNYQNYLT